MDWICPNLFVFLWRVVQRKVLPPTSVVNLDRACDTYGPRWLLLTGSIFFLLSLFTTGLCTEYWQFFLAQALLTGLGCGFTYVTDNGLETHLSYMVMLACIQGYFLKKRALALGIYSSGVSLGGCLCIVLQWRSNTRAHHHR